MSALKAFRQSLTRDQHLFADTLAFIAEHYAYQPQAFDNGGVHNPAGSNEGSCKLLGLATLEGLSTEECLRAFGEHYRAVLANPTGDDHANIRALMLHGLAGVSFAQQPLSRKPA
ncbi:HopJ type III effector protein [Atopomonas sediminilitoris]|uniref:HopJ type III effector protein n=1 Tax=Atopomonas sediminilitoris TaxID=2919919 RepID=UPI001F4EAA3A|nr:HopJ type III effector protein [Atopomonas sediminilitoris]MCJ8170201.1 HopJ type III effector protein [Atopomonas sediminilitoris]